MNGLVVLGLFIFVLAFTFMVAFRMRNKRKVSDVEKYEFPLVWSKAEPVTGEVCHIYEFPTNIVDVDGVPTAIQGTPTLDYNILSTLQGSTNQGQFCLDPDQISAQLVEHTCTAPTSVVKDQITLCTLINGKTVELGATEQYYSNANCKPQHPCVGQLSTVAVNFQVPTQKAYCMDGPFSTMRECDPSNSDQLFRVTRTNPGVNPLSLKQGQGQNSFITQIYDRVNNLCMKVGNTKTESTYIPSFVGATGPNQTVTGLDIVLDTCEDGEFPGYTWFTMPSFEYCDKKDGCTSSEITPVPPQAVYIADIWEDIPYKGYEGLTGLNAIAKFFQDKDAMSMWWGGDLSTPTIAAPFRVDNDEGIDKGATMQYISLPLYNILSASKVCQAGEIEGCISI